MTIPKDTNVRSVAFDVKMLPADPCDTDPTKPECHLGDAGGDAGASPDLLPDGGVRPPPTLDALVYMDVDHGAYYWDLGVIFGVVPAGSRVVSTPETPGIPGSRLIHVDERAMTQPALALNLYPFGHRRRAYSAFESPRTFRRFWGDFFGLQLGLNTDLKVATSSLYGGVLLEPVTGLSLNVGAVVLEGDFLKNGYAEGMVAPTDRNDFVAHSPMVRFYFGFTMSYEFLNTTAAQLPTIVNELNAGGK
jgi:hypothetical protein